MAHLSRKIFLPWRRRTGALLKKLRYWQPDGYNAKRFWHDRLQTFGPDDLRGVGRSFESHEENLRAYEAAAQVMLEVCRTQKINFSQSDILDVGCGVGFYAQAANAEGVKNYRGVDITDALFGTLNKKFPSYTFERLDVSTQELSGVYDLILVIDVTQHITSPQRFSFAMQNLHRHLKPGGNILMTSWLSHRKGTNFYETARTLDAYVKEFPDFICSEPVLFRDKYLFALRAPEERVH